MDIDQEEVLDSLRQLGEHFDTLHAQAVYYRCQMAATLEAMQVLQDERRALLALLKTVTAKTGSERKRPILTVIDGGRV